VPDPSPFEVELGNKKLKSHKSSGVDQIPVELIKAGVRQFTVRFVNLLFSILNREELPEEWKESIIVPIYKKGNKTDCSNYRGISLLPTTYKILTNILLSKLIPYAEELLWINMYLNIIAQLMIIYSAFIKYLRKKWEYSEAVHRLFIDFKERL